MGNRGTFYKKRMGDRGLALQKRTGNRGVNFNEDTGIQRGVIFSIEREIDNIFIRHGRKIEMLLKKNEVVYNKE